MKKWLAVPLCLSALLFCACGGQAVAPTTAVQITTETPTTTEISTTRVLQPLPEGCRLVTSDEAKQKMEKAWEDQSQTDLYSTLSGTKTLFEGKMNEYEPTLILHDEATGEETVVAWGSFGYPSVSYKIDDRYVLWTEYVRGNDYNGIYDTKRMREITLNAGGYILRMKDGYLYAFPPNPDPYEPLCLYRTSLKSLDKKDHLEYDINLLEGLKEADLGEQAYVRWCDLSPDCRYYAVRMEKMGVLIYDLRTQKLALQIPEECIPIPPETYDPLPYLDFINNKTLFCHGTGNAIEITLP
jgi:hypothetical protein